MNNTQTLLAKIGLTFLLIVALIFLYIGISGMVNSLRLDSTAHASANATGSIESLGKAPGYRVEVFRVLDGANTCYLAIGPSYIDLDCIDKTEK